MTAIADTHRNGGDAKQAPALLSGGGAEGNRTKGERMNNITILQQPRTPVDCLIDQLWSEQEQRHAWLFEAGDKIRLMNQREADGLCIKCGGQEYQCECFPEGDY